MCEEQEKPGWREMSCSGGEIERPEESQCHVTNGAVGQGANGGTESPVEYPLPTFLCHMSKEVT